MFSQTGQLHSAAHPIIRSRPPQAPPPLDAHATSGPASIMEFHPTSFSSSTTTATSDGSSSTSSSFFAGKTLVLPVVSHGNVGQLAADLMVNTLGAPSVGAMRRLGCLDHPALLPCVGCGAFADQPAVGCSIPAGGAEARLALGMEVYGAAVEGAGVGLMEHVVVAQQRSEVVSGAQREFAEATADWIASAGFAEVVVMASMPSTAGVAPGQIGGTRFRHVTASGSPDPRRGGPTRQVPTHFSGGLSFYSALISSV